MKYNKIINGIFLKRPNRFIAHVLINDTEEIVHVKNTGRCRELLIPGARVILEDCSHNPNRKTRYSLIAVYKDHMLVNMDSQVPNAVVFEALENNKIDGIRGLPHLKREVTYGKSRFDIYYENNNIKGFVEVKGVTLERDGIAMFPDAPTQRGSKHVLEMINAVDQGYQGTIFFLIQMKGPHIFKTNWEMDKDFSNSISLANQKGVNLIAYDSLVKDDEIMIGSRIEIQL